MSRGSRLRLCCQVSLSAYSSSGSLPLSSATASSRVSTRGASTVEAHGLGRLDDGAGEVGAAQRAEIDQARRQGGGERPVPQQVGVEVGAGGEHDRAGAGAGGVEQEVDEAGDVGLGLLGRRGRDGAGPGCRAPPTGRHRAAGGRCRAPRRRRAGRGLRSASASGSARNRSTWSLDLPVGLERRQVGRGGVEGADQRVQRRVAGAQRDHGPAAAVGAAAQGRDQAGLDHRRLAAAGAADQGQQRLVRGPSRPAPRPPSSRPKNRPASSSRKASRPR